MDSITSALPTSSTPRPSPHKKVLLSLLCGDLHVASHGYRPQITILCQSQINPSLLKKFLVACLFPDHSFAFTTISSVHNMVVTKQSTPHSTRTNWPITMWFLAFSSLKRVGRKQTRDNNERTVPARTVFISGRSRQDSEPHR